MLRRFLVVIAIFTVAFAVGVHAQDRFTDTFRGNGGTQFILRCPAGTVITGVRIKAGAYINNLAPLCDGRVLPQSAGKDGGNQTDTVCPAGSKVFATYFIALRSDNHLLKDIGLYCNPRNGGPQTAFVATNTPGKMTDPIDFLMRDREYPDRKMDCGNQTIVGFQGNSGSSIDAIGLICGSP